MSISRRRYMPGRLGREVGRATPLRKILIAKGVFAFVGEEFLRRITQFMVLNTLSISHEALQGILGRGGVYS